MTMILMYVSSQTGTESAIKDDDKQNKMLPRVRNLENKALQNIFQPKYMRGIQYLLSLIVFCGLMYNSDLFRLGRVYYSFYLSKHKIQYRYNHLFANRMGLNNSTLIHCRFNMNRKQNKSPDKFRGICWLDIFWL